MAISAIAAVAAKEVVAHVGREVATQAVREIAQKMATEAGSQATSGTELQTSMLEQQTSQEGFRVGEMSETKGEGREFAKQKEADAADELRGKLDAEESEPEAKDVQPENVPETETAEIEATENVEIQEPVESIEQVEGQDAFREAIKEETGWSDEIVDNVRNEGSYEIYKNADIREGSTNGGQHLQQPEIDRGYKDDFGRTNEERMRQGLSAYDAKTGEKIELHHMGQKPDSPFAELRENLDHGDGNHHILHDIKSESWRHEPGRVAEYAKQKVEYWKARAEQLWGKEVA